MPVTASWYGRAIELQWDGGNVVNFETADMRTALVTSGYGWTETEKDTHDYFDDLGANQVSGTGYTAYGYVHATQTVSIDATSDEVRFDLDDAQWTTATFTANKAVIYEKDTTDGTSGLMGNIQFGADQSVSAGTFQITWDATGALKIDYT